MGLMFARTYASAGLARSDVEKRVLDILAGFNKVDSNKVTTRLNTFTLLPTGTLDGIEENYQELDGWELPGPIDSQG